MSLSYNFVKKARVSLRGKTLQPSIGRTTSLGLKLGYALRFSLGHYPAVNESDKHSSLFVKRENYIKITFITFSLSKIL